MNEKKIRKFFYLAFPAIIIIAVYVASFFYVQKQKEVKFTEAERIGVISRAPVSFDSVLAVFYPDFIKALIATRQKDKVKAGEYLETAIANWRSLANYYRYNQPKDYYQTRDWTQKVNDIYENLIKAENAARADRLTEAHAGLMVVAQMINDIKSENEKDDISIDMIKFYRQVKTVTDAATKSEVAESSVELKLSFAALKEHRTNTDYQKNMKAIEKIISDLDKLDGPDFFSAKEKLEPAFNELYLALGL